MAERDEIQNTLGGTQFGSSLKDLSDSDLSRGYSDAIPEGSEGYMAGEVRVIDDLEGLRVRQQRFDESQVQGVSAPLGGHMPGDGQT